MAEENGGLSTGMVISIVYGAAHLFLLFILSIYIYVQSNKHGDKLSFKHFIVALWKERGVYSPVIIHIYDTATDVGVLYEWYKLAEIEKSGTNLESLNMEQFFLIAIVFMMVYRFLLGCGGAVVSVIVAHDDLNIVNKCILVIAAFIGFILGALELVVFVGIFVDFKEKNSNERGAGPFQKASQSSEGVLESLPEVIMQSVFYMRAINDDTLNAAAGDIVYLVAFSIAASMLSITSKYIWVDEYMVRESTKSLVIKKDDGENDGVLMGNACCMKGYDISYGYIIRVLWRLAAVTARFIIIALIWVVLGGAIEFILIPTMVLLWYILLFIYVTRGNFKELMKLLKEIVKDTKKDEWDDKGCLYRCLLIFVFFLGFIAVLIGGCILQLGIAVVSGAGIYIIRMIENFILMSIITVFAFVSFDCYRCADAQQRLAYGPGENKRILLWIVVGWLSVIIHAIMSCLMPKVMDDEYEFNLQKLSDEIDKYKVEEATELEYKSEKERTKKKLEEYIESNYDMSKIRVCECGEKFVATKAKWCFYQKYGVYCKYKTGCNTHYERDAIVWHCENKETSEHSRPYSYYVLCEKCVVKQENEYLLALDQAIIARTTDELSAPICECGINMEAEKTGYTAICNECKKVIVWSAWCCPEGDMDEHNTEDGYSYLCAECGAKSKKKKDKKSQILNEIETMIEIAKQKPDDKSVPNCDCGNKLIAIQANECYEGGAVKCNKCGKNCSDNDMVWHCIKGNVEPHPSGYDLCVDCGVGDIQEKDHENIVEEAGMETITTNDMERE